MNIIIKGLSDKAWDRVRDEMNPSRWIKTWETQETGCIDVILGDYTIVKANHDRLHLDCAGHLSSINSDEFVEVSIV